MKRKIWLCTVAAIAMVAAMGITPRQSGAQVCAAKRLCLASGSSCCSWNNGTSDCCKGTICTSGWGTCGTQPPVFGGVCQ